MSGNGFSRAAFKSQPLVQSIPMLMFLCSLSNIAQGFEEAVVKMKMLDMSSILIQHSSKASINCVEKNFAQPVSFEREVNTATLWPKNPDQVFFRHLLTFDQYASHHKLSMMIIIIIMMMVIIMIMISVVVMVTMMLKPILSYITISYNILPNAIKS